MVSRCAHRARTISPSRVPQVLDLSISLCPGQRAAQTGASFSPAKPCRAEMRPSPCTRSVRDPLGMGGARTNVVVGNRTQPLELRLSCQGTPIGLQLRASNESLLVILLHTRLLRREPPGRRSLRASDEHCVIVRVLRARTTVWRIPAYFLSLIARSTSRPASRAFMESRRS